MKYELVNDNKITYDNITLFQIRALKDFGDIKKGDLGGYVQHPLNLSQEDSCWLHKDSICWEGGRVMDNSQIYGKSVIGGVATIKGESLISNSEISGKTTVQDTVRVYRSNIKGNPIIKDNAVVKNAILNLNEVVVSRNITSISINSFERLESIDRLCTSQQ